MKLEVKFKMLYPEEVEVGEGLVVHGGPGGDVAMQSTPLPEGMQQYR